ncbi:MAG TPA: GNAT family N-acetyltransferase [Clostridia bacterium]|nr:GNAT family N-acetyltransferase [Clostridia bacterium]
MLLVFGPRSAEYDFGPAHPLTPRRFGPGLDLLRSVGAAPGLAPEPCVDAALLACHSARYVEVVRAFSRDPFGLPAAGIAEGGDVPPFAGMHEAAAMVANGSLGAIEAVLAGDAEHAFHPGGGLHHAMRDRASGFCIYNDPALAIARARRDGLRVLYVDLDVHHGDGVQALFADDPGVLTLSFHETGRYLFPGTGFADELGEGIAAGSAVNVPLEPGCGEAPWLEAVRALVPQLAAAFGPDLVVSQHGADSHAWDPLAHLRVTTTAMGDAARTVDAVAHRWAGGRWLATGGGGYDAYRVVPRSWSLVWLAGAHQDVPATTPAAWRERWAAEAARYGQGPLPAAFTDAPNAGEPFDLTQEAAEARSRRTVDGVRRVVLPALLRTAVDRGWWDPTRPLGHALPPGASTAGGAPTVHAHVDAARLGELRIADRVLPFGSMVDAQEVLRAALAAERAAVGLTAAVVQDVIVGAVVSAVDEAEPGRRDLLAVGVAPGHRGHGLATAMLRAHVESRRPGDDAWRAVVTVAERDPVAPLDRSVRADIARRLLERAGFQARPADGPVRSIDASALEAVRGA